MLSITEMRYTKHMRQRRRRVITVIALLAALAAWIVQTIPQSQLIATPQRRSGGGELASVVLETLPVKGRAPKTGYKRAQFGDGWAKLGDCDTRNLILQRDLKDVILEDDKCKVRTGALNDPYTGKDIAFARGASTSAAVQIDHVVALSNAWQTGAQQLSAERRVQLANDPLELLAVDGPANQQKGDGDAATWLPSNKPFRCQYIARQIAVKRKYALWVTEPEKAAMARVLSSCPEQIMPA